MGIQIRELMVWAKHRKVLATLLVVVTLSVGILIGTVVSGRVGAAKNLVGGGATPLAIPDPVQLSSTFAAIVNKVEPAVVNISTTQVIERKHGTRRARGNREQDPFQDFFDRFFDFPDQRPAPRPTLCSRWSGEKNGDV